MMIFRRQSNTVKGQGEERLISNLEVIKIRLSKSLIYYMFSSLHEE